MDRVTRRGPLARAPGALKSHNAEKLKGETPLRFFNIHSVAKHEKNKKKYFREKISQCRKKLEGGDPLGFSNIHSVAKHQKNAGDPLGKKISEKNVSQCRKKLKGGTLWSCPVWCYAEKQVKPFWSKSLGQMVQFDTIIF